MDNIRLDQTHFDHTVHSNSQHNIIITTNLNNNSVKQLKGCTPFSQTPNQSHPQSSPITKQQLYNDHDSIVVKRNSFKFKLYYNNLFTFLTIFFVFILLFQITSAQPSTLALVSGNIAQGFFPTSDLILKDPNYYDFLFGQIGTEIYCSIGTLISLTISSQLSPSYLSMYD
jgi:hypothetical protein